MSDRFVSRVGGQLNVFEQAVERIHAASENSPTTRADVVDRRDGGRAPQRDHAVVVAPPSDGRLDELALAI
jgi:hypothetical protein